MKMTKKILSLLLSLMLVLGTVMIAAFSAGADTGSYTVGDTVKFGTYPQSRVESTAALSQAAEGAEWKSFNYYSGTGGATGWSNGTMAPGDYMKYADFFLEGAKYRAVSFSELRPRATGLTHDADYSYMDEYGYAVNTVYYFKFEPVEWRVLDPESGLVMCTSAIDSQAYNNFVYTLGGKKWGDSEATCFASDYKNSSIRKWLNDDFYNTAFTAEQKDNISFSGSLDNSSSYNSAYDSDSTNDKVFLLSFGEATNSGYGFKSSPDEADPAKSVSATAYAECQGIYETDEHSVCWWLRSPGSNSDGASLIKPGGQAYYYNYVYLTETGIVPALKLKEIKSGTAFAPLYENIDIEIEGGDYEQGETPIVTVTLPSDAEGKVYFFIDGDTLLGECTVSNGAASYALGGIAGGSHTVFAVYDGDGKYKSATSPAVSLNIEKATPTLGVSVSDENPVYGENITITANLPENATETVTFSLDAVDTGTAVTVENGKAVYVIKGTSVNAGSHSVLASYSGDGTYSSASVEVPFSVSPKAVTITAGSNSKVYDGSALTESGFTASALEENDTHTFTVVMTEGSTVINAGTKFNVIAKVDGTSLTTDIWDAASQSYKVGNYLVTTENGKLSITPRKVTVTITGMHNSTPYDGEEHIVSDFIAESSDPLYKCSGETLYFNFTGTAKASRTDAGTTYMGLTDSQFVNKNANFDVTFDVTDGYQKILAPTVTVTVKGNSAEADYDGSEHIASGYTATADNEFYDVENDISFSGTAEAKRTEPGTESMGLDAGQFTNTNTKFDVTFEVEEDGILTVNPVVKFVNEDGKELQSSAVALGTTPGYTGETPTKEKDEWFTYEFDKWTPDIAAANDNATYTASFTPVPIEYTATFVDENGNVIGTAAYTVNTEKLDEPEVPAKEGYEGAWEEYELGAGNITIKPVYTPTNICKLDHKYHGDTFWGKLVTFVHNLIWTAFSFIGIDLYVSIKID